MATPFPAEGESRLLQPLTERLLRTLDRRATTDGVVIVSPVRIAAKMRIPASQVFSLLTELQEARFIEYSLTNPVVVVTPRGHVYARRQDA